MASTSFYQATVPTFKGIANSAVGFLTAAKEEQAKNSSLPSDQDLLNAQLGDMLPFRMQPILVGKFPLDGVTTLKLNGSAAPPNLDPSSFSSLDDVINFFKQFAAVFDAVDEKTYNESAGKSFDVTVAGKTMTMSNLAEYYNSFVIPNSYFHLNAMYMLLRSKGFALGKGKYLSPFFTEQAKKDWAPLMG
ncbi:hypothetical protein J4E90_007639 [Alternaria incomplexa]|uniref:uncharacterized protein n=1 Tax=Alternaria incomplexa TaxID=1187928 RepID=UPI00221FE0E0|nr:uncharacterized protein J4E90_007639 [Alternaria incomplexa]KAI4910207.1 hypothetical protein J4E90_007639 [Alternaria incomplexa]